MNNKFKVGDIVVSKLDIMNSSVRFEFATKEVRNYKNLFASKTRMKVIRASDPDSYSDFYTCKPLLGRKNYDFMSDEIELVSRKRLLVRDLL